MSYNKVKFDKSPFNKSSKSDNFDIDIVSTSDFRVQLQMKTPLSDYSLSGSGEITPNLVMLQDASTNFESKSDLIMGDIVLSLAMSSKILGDGDIDYSPKVTSPFDWEVSGTGGVSTDDRMFLYQTIDAPVKSTGTVILNIHMKTELEPFYLNGRGDADFGVAMQIPLVIGIGGKGDLDLRRLGALNENTIELIGVDIPPGQTVTIDTDLLQVLIGAVEDVSSVTTESVFFELNPGENEITVRTDTGQKLEVVAIWQNRWL